jgi:hypothetical protein
MNDTVPLWAFVALGLAAPTLALLGIVFSVRAENKRSHRNWLRQTKHDAYAAMFEAYHAMNREFGDHLNLHLDGDDASETRRLEAAHDTFKDLYERANLVASMRVSLAAQTELMRTWFHIYSHLEAHKKGETPPGPPTEGWGDEQKTRDAVRYDLGVRRDPEVFGGHYDRRSSVPASRLTYSIQRTWWRWIMRYDK